MYHLPSGESIPESIYKKGDILSVETEDVLFIGDYKKVNQRLFVMKNKRFLVANSENLYSFRSETTLRDGYTLILIFNLQTEISQKHNNAENKLFTLAHSPTFNYFRV